MSKQCLSIAQMKHLHELGLNSSKASMCWVKFDGEQGYNILLPKDEELFEALVVINYIPTFTLQDILDVLPKDISREGCTWSASLYIDYENNRIAYGNTDRDGFEIYYEVPICENIIDAAYEMLGWVLTNKYIQ